MQMISRILLAIGKRVPRGYWRVIRLAARRDPDLWDLRLPLRYLPETTLRADLREPVFTQFLRHGCFPHQVGEDLLCMSFLRPGDRVFDIGANIGYPTILLSELVGSDGFLLALEPSNRAYRLLERNLSEQPNAVLANLAVSDHFGETPFYETASLDTSSLETVPGIKPYFVSTTTIDRLVEEFGRPDFIKIDVEGHEPAVFRGMAGLLGSDRPPIILFEALTEQARSDVLVELRALAPDRYDVHRIEYDGSLHPENVPRGTNNYLAIPEWGRERLARVGSDSG